MIGKIIDFRNRKWRLHIGNNQGSTLVIVLVVIAFVSILGTVTVSSAMLNLKMKTVDKESKKSFYTAEEAVDQVYAGLGIVCMNDLNECYKNELATLTRIVANKPSEDSNENYNKEFRVNYLNKLLSDIFCITNWNNYSQNIPEQNPSGIHDTNESQSAEQTNTSNAFIAAANSYLEQNGTGLEIISAGTKNVVVETGDSTHLDNYKIVVHNCVVKFLNTQGYYSLVTFDLSLGLPDTLFNFVEPSNDKLKTYGEFSLIGCSGINVLNQRNLNLSGAKAYAGGTGLNIGFQSGVNAIDQSLLVAASGIKVGTNVSQSGEVNVNHKSNSSLNVSDDSQLWSEGIDVSDEVTDSSVNLYGNTFVKDDLTINGDHNNAVIKGNYVGWSYDDPSKAFDEIGHNDSSSIIVNGTNSILDMRSVTSMILGGRSYINIEKIGKTYGTGESISLKADQEMYLIPDAFLKKFNGNSAEDYYMNPVAAGSEVNVKIPDNFFAKKNGWLVEDINEKEFVTYQVGNLVYYYFNIKKENKQDYVNAIINYNPADGSDVYLAALKNLVVSNVTKLNQSLLTPGIDSNVFLNGAMVGATIVKNKNAEITNTQASMSSNFIQDPKVLPSNETSNQQSIQGQNSFQINDKDLDVRFGLLKTMLYQRSFYNDGSELSQNKAFVDGSRAVYSSSPKDVYYKSHPVKVDKMGADIFDNFINSQWLNNELHDHAYVPEDQKADTECKVYITKKAFDHTLRINSTGVAGSVNMTKGLIITDGDVSIEQDFDGLIIARGTIFINKTINDHTAKITNSYGDIDTLLSQLVSDTDRQDVENFFRAWNESTVNNGTLHTNNGIVDIGYEDLIQIENWKKQ